MTSTAASPPRLGTWDYVSLSAVVILASSVGVYQIFAAKKSKNARDFLLKSRDLGVAPLILSTTGTFVSAIGILGLSSETYTNGAQFMLLPISYSFSIPLNMYLYLTVFYNLGTNTIYEYLEYRFNKFLRLCASALLILQTVAYTAVVIYAPALALSQVAGLHLWASVGSIGIVCIIYTSMGGIKAVVWADACQVIVMLAVIVLIVVKGILDMGGIGEIWRIAAEGERTKFYFFSSSKYTSYTVMTTVIASGGTFLSITATNQMLVQRYLSNKTLTKARLTSAGGTVGVALIVILCTFSGLICYARYHNCDPLLSGQVTSNDQLLALFAVETLSFCEGLAGIFVAAVLCATLSTLSSTLNSLSALTMEDFIRPRKPHLSEESATKISKILAIVYGVICIAFVAVAESASGIVKLTFIIQGVLGGPVFALFTVGMLLPWVNSTGATVAMLSCFLFCGWHSIGGLLAGVAPLAAPVGSAGCNFTNSIFANESWSEFTSVWNKSTTLIMNESNVDESSGVMEIYTYSPLWYVLWSVGIGLIVSLITSIVTGVQNPENVDPMLVFPFVVNTIRKLPRSYQRYLGFDVENSNFLKKQSMSQKEERSSNRVSVEDIILKPGETIELIKMSAGHAPSSVPLENSKYNQNDNDERESNM